MHVRALLHSQCAQQSLRVLPRFPGSTAVTACDDSRGATPEWLALLVVVLASVGTYSITVAGAFV